uniref:eRF1 domain-containing protein n=1 Tax=Eucampia antarctica TaxID=49252 RepID=A0A7S2R622_9STRA
MCKASSGHKHALEEVFSDPDIMCQITDTKVAKEVNVLNKFMRMMDTNPDKAYYGYCHVAKANEELAIESLLVTDELFRSSDIVTRKKYVRLVESVRENGGIVYIFSSLHVSGAQLQQVSGVAALLRYPLPDLDALEAEAETTASLNDSDTDDDDEIIDPQARINDDVQGMNLDF